MNISHALHHRATLPAELFLKHSRYILIVFAVVDLILTHSTAFLNKQMFLATSKQCVSQIIHP
jgi:hypothetical protein